MSDKRKLNDGELDTVIGGLGEVPMPMPTGGVTYQCPKCGQTITASTRDMTVTCPNVRCRSCFRVERGQLILEQQTAKTTLL